MTEMKKTIMGLAKKMAKKLKIINKKQKTMNEGTEIEKNYQGPSRARRRITPRPKSPRRKRKL
jgi:hypothetical protein